MTTDHEALVKWLEDLNRPPPTRAEVAAAITNLTALVREMATSGAALRDDIIMRAEEEDEVGQPIVDIGRTAWDNFCAVLLKLKEFS